MKKEYVLRIIVCCEDDAAELLTEYYDDEADTDVRAMSFEIEWENKPIQVVTIPASIMKHFVNLESDILGVS